eukprot:1612016-Alexandrium_andersonii.AAC.1
MAGNKRSMLRAVAPEGGGGLDSAAMSLAECFSSIIGSALVLHVWGWRAMPGCACARRAPAG